MELASLTCPVYILLSLRWRGLWSTCRTPVGAEMRMMRLTETEPAEKHIYGASVSTSVQGVSGRTPFCFAALAPAR